MHEGTASDRDWQYRLLADHSVDVIWLLDVDTLRFDYVSPSVEQLRGYTVDEVMAQGLDEILTPSGLPLLSDELPARLAAYLAGDESQRTHVTEVDQPRRDGTIVPTEVVTTFVRGDDGSVRVLGVSRDISARRHAEAELRRSEARFRSVFESIPIGLLLVTAGGEVVTANSEAERLLGVGIGGFRGRRAVDLDWVPCDESGTPIPFEERPLPLVLRTGRPVPPRKVSVQFADRAEPAWFEFSAVPLFEDDSGSPTGGFVLFWEITDEHRHEVELRAWTDELARSHEQLVRERERLERATAAGRVSLVEWDVRSDRLAISGFAAPLFPTGTGLFPSTFADAADWIHPDDLAEVRRALDAALDGAPLSVEFRARSFEGDTAWLRVDGEVRVDDGGAPVLFGAMVDVTELKRAHQALQATNRALEEAQRVASIGSWTLDRRTGEVRWSEEVYRILGLDPATTASDLDTVLARTHPDDREIVDVEFRRLVVTGQEHSLEHRIVRTDGEVRWVAERGRAEFDDDGKVERITGTVQDVTDRKLAEQAALLAEARDRAEDASRAKSAFLANMSHEIRTPMSAIVGFHQLLERDPDLTERQRELLGSIGRSSEHLMNLLEDVLDISRIEAERVTLRPERVVVRELVAGIGDLFRSDLDTRGAPLVVETEPGTPDAVVLDPGRVRQILVNLVSNSIKFAPTGSITVRVRSGSAPDLLEFEVEDGGPGIADHELPTLFDPFEQFERAGGRRAGTGLGLPISRGLARLMGGDITVERPAGGGSRFRVSLLAPVAAAAPAPAVEPVGDVVGLADDQAPLRVLVVDDSADVRSILAEMLEEVGFVVDTADDGAPAVERFRAARPDCVLMDLRMPVMDGMAAVRAIRAIESGAPPVPVIGVSASSFDDDRRRFVAAGGSAFVGKPFLREVVLDLIGDLTGCRYRRR